MQEHGFARARPHDAVPVPVPPFAPQAALAAERYDEAALLRDQALVGLQGWWSGKSGNDDFSGHLLHVKAEFGRLTGRIYTARDIAQMNGWRDSTRFAGPLGGGGSAACGEGP